MEYSVTFIIYLYQQIYIYMHLLVQRNNKCNALLHSCSKLRCRELHDRQPYSTVTDQSTGLDITAGRRNSSLPYTSR